MHVPVLRMCGRVARINHRPGGRLGGNQWCVPVTYSIAYVGPGLAGRRASLASVLCAHGSDADALTVRPNQEYSFIHKGQPVAAWLCSARSIYAYEDESDAPAAVKVELDRLAGIDGLLFVLDSQVARQGANQYELEKLQRDLRGRGLDLEPIPKVDSEVISAG